MSVIVYIEIENGLVKKSSQEAAFYGSEVAKMQGTTSIGLAIGEINEQELSMLGNFGISKVIHVNNPQLAQINIMPYANVLSQVVEQTNSKFVIFSKSSSADAIASRAAAKLKASIVTNAVELPDFSNGTNIKRSIYTGKAFANVSLTADVKIIGIKKNAVSIVQTSEKASVEKQDIALAESNFTSKILSTQKATGQISLPEADIVVSAGRGLKAPENWGIVEDLAKVLGAATACSKPVSDLDWRPHHEHVGQTGIKVSPNLYIACGISGAIQHLAGVNSSKVIVVINTDPEAPFFKSADYGIVGDVFDVLPQLTKAVANLK
ncbi:MAG: electron transfer flavoprotein subunit alpha/FixB family protein [Pseudarcicella sp.]|nr:electron transfer flavoprotein subunit alpha/FixB family protein [Pseudarcicella sp.]